MDRTPSETSAESSNGDPPAVSPTGGLDAHLAAVVEHSDDAIISKDLNGIIQSWNKGAERVFGYTADEVIGKSITILMPPERVNEEPDILARIRSGERVDHYETVRRRKDGTLIDISLSVSPIKDGSGKIVAASKIARDITARRRLETQRDQLLAAERAARAEAERISLMKDEFLATLSHELRTPLNAILGWAQVLRAKADLDTDLTEGLSVIERNTRLQTQLIDDLLDMSRIISGKVRLDVQRVDLQHVLNESIASVRQSADARGVRLTSALDPLAGSVRGDPARLQQCIWNLLSNAIKFTPRGGKVHVTLERVNSHLEICVADTGQGIAPELLPHVFERFRQGDASTTRKHGGLGLGLSIVKYLIELHGGMVRAKSAGLEKGATFCIELPLIAVDGPGTHPGSEHLAHANPPGVSDRPELHGIKVLALDDEPDSIRLVQRVLEECGATVLLATSVPTALQIVQSQRPHLILSDIGMPEEDGYSFIKKVRALPAESGGRTIAVALTAFARAQDRTRALRAGYQTHIAKPVDASELCAVVASLTDGLRP